MPLSTFIRRMRLGWGYPMMDLTDGYVASFSARLTTFTQAYSMMRLLPASAAVAG